MSVTAKDYRDLAVKAARLAAGSTTLAEANHWWAECERYEALAAGCVERAGC